MTENQCMTLLGEWEGYQRGAVGRVTGEEAACPNEPEAWIELVPDRQHSHYCSGCGPSEHVAEYFGLGWNTVKAIDLAYLEATLGPVDLSNLTANGFYGSGVATVERTSGPSSSCRARRVATDSKWWRWI